MSDGLKSWVGRFAPTPSGSLHFGSLVAALGSYLIAKHHHGEWLLRIEDLDPPRVVKGAVDDILRTLEVFGFEWDSAVIYQSQRGAFYQAAIDKLKQLNLVYPCSCSRKQILQRNAGVYDNYCRHKQIEDNLSNYALRARFSHRWSDFEDNILGRCSFCTSADTQDFVVQRRDGLYAYQLAVVVDDIQQGVNHVVRGADIIDSTPRQNFLYQALGYQPPEYYHLPLVVDEQGEKLSKRKFSTAIGGYNPGEWLIKALQHLEQPVLPEMNQSHPSEILALAVENWQLNKVPYQSKVFSPFS